MDFTTELGRFTPLERFNLKCIFLGDNKPSETQETERIHHKTFQNHFTVQFRTGLTTKSCLDRKNTISSNDEAEKLETSSQPLTCKNFMESPNRMSPLLLANLKLDEIVSTIHNLLNVPWVRG